MKKLIGVALVLVLGGCVSYSKSITREAASSNQSAYLYGIFKIDAPKAWLGMQGHQSMGFVFTCADKKQYTIGFKIENPLQVIEVTPSTCSLSKIVYVDADGMILQERNIPAGVFSERVFTAGKAYYLGDYFAKSETTNNFMSSLTTWKIVDSKDNYIQTTQQMQTIFPNFRAFVTVPMPVMPTDSYN